MRITAAVMTHADAMVSRRRTALEDVEAVGRAVTSVKPGDRVMGGGGQMPRFLESLMELRRQGRFPLEKLVRFYDFADVNRAVDDSNAGTTIKPIPQDASLTRRRPMTDHKKGESGSKAV